MFTPDDAVFLQRIGVSVDFPDVDISPPRKWGNSFSSDISLEEKMRVLYTLATPDGTGRAIVLEEYRSILQDILDSTEMHQEARDAITKELGHAAEYDRMVVPIQNVTELYRICCPVQRRTR